MALRYGAAVAPNAGGGGGGGGGGGEWAVWSDPSELSSALAEALAADESGELPDDPRDVTVDVVRRRPGSATPPGTPPRGGPVHHGQTVRGGGGGGGGDDVQVGQGTAQLEALSLLRLTLRVPWPLTLVIPETCLERYNAAAVFLLQVRRARAALDEVVKSGWSASARRTRGGGGGGGFHARRLLAELRHFVAVLHEHVVSRVLHSAWRDLIVAVDKADSPRAAREAHAEFLDATARQCLVSPDQTWTLLAGQVKAALAIACDFGRAVNYILIHFISILYMLGSN